MKQLRETVAYCGLICGVCPGVGQCDCRTAPKPEEAGCYQRNCCIKKEIDGCWECNEFPCSNGYFGEQHGGWRGLCVASVQCVRDNGPEALVNLVVQRHGLRMDHSLYMDRTPDEVLEILRSTDAVSRCLGGEQAGDE